jgi:hypothetical protein
MRGFTVFVQFLPGFDRVQTLGHQPTPLPATCSG